ncbi:MAG TPA: ATP-binding protein, partial [Pseudobdellovibrionaceae bacterium]|nr:ATP-binding protein [Pseudobdellovibrionaceae bacterium]
DPLEIEPQEQPYDRVEISGDGLTLTIPPVANTPSLKLTYPWSGRSLFTKESKSLAQQIVALIAQAESSRKAYDRGVAEERRRMAQDLHDDVGARLLTGLHSVDDKFKPLLQGAIAEIRSIVSGMTGENIPLEVLLADLRHEALQRLSAVNVNLDWPLAEESALNRALDYRQQKALGSAMREVISNVIRHSGASHLTVRIREDESVLRVSVADNGKGFAVPSLDEKTQGFGLRSLRRRLKDAGGAIHIDSSPSGTLVIFEIPYGI